MSRSNQWRNQFRYAPLRAFIYARGIWRGSKLSRKFMAVLCISFLSTLVVSLSGLQYFRKQSQNTENIVDQVANQMQSAFRLNQLFLEMDREEKALFLSLDYREFLKRSPAVSQTAARISDLIRKLQQEQLPETAADLEEISKDFAFYLKIRTELIHLMELDFILHGAGASGEWRGTSLRHLQQTITRVIENCREALQRKPGISLGACTAIGTDIQELLAKIDRGQNNIVFTYLRSGDPGLADTSKAVHIHTLYTRLQELGKVLDPAQQELLKPHIKMLKTWLIAHAGSDQPVLSANGSPQVSSFKAWEIRKRIEALIESVIRNSEAALAARKEFSAKIFSQSQNVFIVVSLACMALASLLGLLILNSVRKPIRAITRMAERVSEGDLDAHVSYRYPDEIGVMGRAFNKMTENLREFTKELENARTTAEQANKTKSAFLAQMSHEIRTPLNAVIGLSDILAETPASKEVRGYVRKINSAAGTLLQIINDLLDVTRIEAGKLHIEQTTFDLPGLISDTINLFVERARSKKIALETELEDSCHRHFTGDPLRVQQILINLVNNAIKFTHFGSVTVKVVCEPQEENLALVLIEVRDTGIGISKEKIDQLFEPYDQAESSTARKFGGSGLGLHITKSLVELMGGTVSVRSKVSLGSCFSVQLPLPMVADEDVQPEAGEGSLQQETAGIDLPILIVDDNELNREVLSVILRQQNLEVLTAENGEKAIALLEVRPFALVFMDCLMDGMDGFETARKIREESRQPEVPIVGLTAGLVEDFQEKCLNAGMNDFLQKPVERAKVFRALGRWALGANGESGRELGPDVTNSESSDGRINMEVLSQILTIDAEQRSELFTLIEKNLCKATADLRVALKEQNLERISHLAHTVKGSTASIGSLVVPRISARVERSVGERNHEQISTDVDLLLKEIDQFRTDLKAWTGLAQHDA